jgi:hypothetical protein
MIVKSLDEVAKEYQPLVGKSDFVNTFAANGPIVLKDGSDYYLWTDKKTAGYPNKGIIGKLVFKGGNWRDINDNTPIATYVKEIIEEIQNNPLTPEGTDSHVHALIARSLLPVADYFSAIPANLLLNDNLKEPFYCYISSVLNAEIEMGRLCDLLDVSRVGGKIRNLERALQFISAESNVKLTSFDELIKGEHTLFGFGDDYKLADCLDELYGIKDTNMKFIEGVSVCRLKSIPTTPYSYRKEALLKYLRKDNNPFLLNQVADKKVFEKRE